MRHGIQREVFICQLASNATKILQSGKGKPDVSALLSVSEIAGLALDRWMIPRSRNVPEYRGWTPTDLIDLFGSQAQILRVEAKREVMLGNSCKC